MLTPLEDFRNRHFYFSEYITHTDNESDEYIKCMVEEALEIPEEPIDDTALSTKTRQETIKQLSTRIHRYKNIRRSIESCDSNVIKEYMKEGYISSDCDTARGREIIEIITNLPSITEYKISYKIERFLKLFKKDRYIFC